MRDEMAVPGKCEQSTPPSHSQAKKIFQTSTFHKFESLNDNMPSFCTFRILSEVCILNPQSDAN